jgi:voltage-gated potassium channel
MGAMESATLSDEQQDVVSESVHRFADRVRTPGDLRKLSDFERIMYVPLLLSAILPIVTAASRASDDSWVSIIVNVVAWLVFVVDLAIHVRYVPRYLSTRLGVFDLVVVIITAPWFLIPGLGGSQILVLARLARLARLLFVSKSARRALSRLGRVGLFALGMLLFSSWMAYVAEHPTNSEFATFGDALWWGIVTLSTVGYGDIVPETEKGRVAGTFLMVTGLATLGLIAGTLASAFRLAPAGTKDPGRPPDANASSAAEQGSTDAILAELAAVREHLATLERRLPAAGATPTRE